MRPLLRVQRDFVARLNECGPLNVFTSCLYSLLCRAYDIYPTPLTQVRHLLYRGGCEHDANPILPCFIIVGIHYRSARNKYSTFSFSSVIGAMRDGTANGDLISQ